MSLRLASSRARRLAALLLVATALAAPAAAGEFAAPGGSFTVRVETLKERRFRTVVPQTHDYSCGAAAAATLLSRHYRLDTTETEALASMLARGDPATIVREGFSMLDLKQLLASRGLQADGYRVTIDELARLGVPAIALLSEAGYRHFVVIQGVRGDRVLLADPAIGLRTVTRDAFAHASSGVLLVVRSRPAVARASFNDARAWGGAPAAPLVDALAGDSLASRLLALPGRHDL